jgi:hypothetical protein
MDVINTDIKVDIEEMLKWLEDAWLNGGLKEHLTEEQYLTLREIFEEWDPYWPLKR